MKCNDFLSHQVVEAASIVAKLQHGGERRLDELKVVEGENLFDGDLSILIPICSLDKVFQKVADQCELLCDHRNYQEDLKHNSPDPETV